MELYIIRHGESIGNIVPEDTPDGELTALGRSQAERVAECMSGTPLDLIISSPLIRAMETARPLARRHHLPIHVWKDTFEVRNKGPYTGPTRDQMLSQFPEAILRDDFETEGWFCSGDESEEDAHLRAQRIFAELLGLDRDRRVALFAHSGFNRHLLRVVLGLDHKSPVFFHQSNGCIYWVTIDEHRTTLQYVGETRSPE